MQMLLDIRYALRLLLKSPKFAGVTLFVLVGGLSISLYTFSFLYSLIYKPIPLPEGDSALTVSAQLNENRQQVPAYEFSKIRSQLTNFAELGAYSDSKLRLYFENEGKNVSGSYVEQNFFRFSRTEPILGRVFQSDEMKSDAQKVAVISFSIWQEYFAGEENVIGKNITINNKLVTVIGVMPEYYRFPDVAKIWLPISYKLANPDSFGEEQLNIFARLKDGESVQEVENEFSTLLNNVYQQRVIQYDAPEGTLSVKLLSFSQAQFAGAGSVIFIFLNAVAFMILLLACINVGNLLLARAIERQKETAIRAAVGASHGRLVAQLMWEGILVTTVGGLMAMLLAGAGLSYTDMFLSMLLPEDIPFWWHWGMDLPTVMMAIVFCLITLFLCSYLPARNAVNQNVNSTLRDGTRGAQSRKAGRLSRNLITAQVFLVSLLMLIGSVAAYVSQFLLNLDMGFTNTSVLGADVMLPVQQYKTESQKIRFYQQLLERIKQQQSVEDAVIMSKFGENAFSLPEMDFSREQDKPKIDTYGLIGNTDFYGIRLLEGRRLDKRDDGSARKSALISQSLANRYWLGESALEKRVQLTINGETKWLFVVGVVSDRSNVTSLFSPKDSEDEIYVSALQFPQSVSRALIKYTGNFKAGEEAFYNALYFLNAELEPEKLASMEKSLERVRNILQLISNITFSAGFFALLLALTGIYGLTVNSVVQRKNEIGVRRAVGAKDNQIIQLFLFQGIKQLVIGIGFALLLFSIISFALNNLTQGAVPIYLYVLLALSVVAGLTSTVIIAVFLPTRQAVQCEPSTVLRYE